MCGGSFPTIKGDGEAGGWGLYTCSQSDGMCKEVLFLCWRMGEKVGLEKIKEKRAGVCGYELGWVAGAFIGVKWE